jgi:hypothetical protein
VAVFIVNETGKFRELENNAITRPTVFYYSIVAGKLTFWL